MPSIDESGECSVFLRPRCLDDDGNVGKRIRAPTKARRSRPAINAKLTKLYFISNEVANRAMIGHRRKTGTETLSRLSCKNCRRVFHKRVGLAMHTCNYVGVKLRRLRNHRYVPGPVPTSSALLNDSVGASGRQGCFRRLEVKLQRCEVPSSFNPILQPPATAPCNPLLLQPSIAKLASPPTTSKYASPASYGKPDRKSADTSKAWDSASLRSSAKRVGSLPIVSVPAKIPFIEDMVKITKRDDIRDMVKFKEGDDEDDEVVILWQG